MTSDISIQHLRRKNQCAYTVQTRMTTNDELASVAEDTVRVI